MLCGIYIMRASLVSFVRMFNFLHVTSFITARGSSFGKRVEAKLRKNTLN